MLDFRKAFDSVWHEGLFYKLLKINIGGHFYNLIKSLYCNSTCSIRIGENTTWSFLYSRGVRQGCILSPLLFNRYINNLLYLFQKKKEAVWSICSSKWNKNKFTIVCRLFDHPIQIQNRITKLFKFSLFTLQTWMLKVNPKKTKIMIFQKRSRKSVDINFNIGTEPTEIVQEYTYLVHV